MKFVYDNGTDLREAEVDASFWLTLGDWSFHTFGRDHDDDSNTPGINDRIYDPNRHAITALDLRPRQDADHVWELTGQIHASLARHGVDIKYDIEQNSNSFVTSVLDAIGIPLTPGLLAQVTPPDVARFPGAFVDVFQDGARITPWVSTRSPIVLELAGTAGNDYIQSGIGNDTLGGAAGRDTVYGDSGHDLIRGGDGSDRLYGDGGHDRIDGAASGTFCAAATGMTRFGVGMAMIS